MKLRHLLVLILAAALLAACNFTLAEDVTPPPDYVPPTAAATMGPLFPPAAPDVEAGAAIFAEKCAPCHGAAGLGDGPQGAQLPVSVPALGVPAVAQKASPSAWYMIVTQGNLERFMPPFSSLNDQQRWDVVAYALTLHVAPEQLELGKSLVEDGCPDCAKVLSGDPEMMAALSAADLINVMKQGMGGLPDFGKDFSDEESLAAAAYLRSLTFASAPVAAAEAATPTPANTETAAADNGTPSAATPESGTPESGTPQAQVEVTAVPTLAEGFGRISGTIDNQTGKALPANITITLRAMEHGADMNAGPSEISAVETTANADGSFVFENVEMPENRIFIAEANVNGEIYQSDFAVVEAGMTELSLPSIALFAASDDFSTLVVESLQLHFDFASESEVQIFGVYTVSNPTEKSIQVTLQDQQPIPFVPFPEGATPLGYEATQDSAAFVQTADGFAMPPSDTPYGLIAFASYPKSDSITVTQKLVLPVNGVSILLPEGISAEGENLVDDGTQTMQTSTFHIYSTGALKAGDTLEFTLSGKVKDAAGAANTADLTQNQTLLIGVGALGLVLIVAGVWIFMRDRKSGSEVEEDAADEDDDQDVESVMDAIIALDDLHRSGKISDEAYQKRRAELKDSLKRNS